MIEKTHIQGEGILYKRGKVSLTSVALTIVKKDQKSPNPGIYGRSIIRLQVALSNSKHKDELNTADDLPESKILCKKFWAQIKFCIQIPD